MKIIRKHTFETNSSSCHSIVIDKVSANKIKKVKPCELKISLDKEYGWNGTPLKSIAEKLNYVIAHLVFFNQDYDGAIKLLSKFDENGYIIIFKDCDFEYYLKYGEDDEEGNSDFDELEDTLLNSDEYIFKPSDFDDGHYHILKEHTFYIDYESSYLFDGYTLDELYEMILDNRQEIHIVNDNDDFHERSYAEHKTIKKVLKQMKAKYPDLWKEAEKEAREYDEDCCKEDFKNHTLNFFYYLVRYKDDFINQIEIIS